MIVGAAILPTAPLLVPGVSATLPPGVPAVCDAIDATLDRLPDHDVAVLVAGSSHGSLYDAAHATLAPIGLPGVEQIGKVDPVALERLSGLTQYAVQRGEPLPLALTVLALLAGDYRPVVPVDVPSGASFDALTAIGVGIAGAMDAPDIRAVVIAAGDLSAGLTERSPLHLLEGAEQFDAQVVDIVDRGRLDDLARLGPEEAKRVGAAGWAPMSALHGALARAKIGLVRRHYSAPRGVGYLVAHGA